MLFDSHAHINDKVFRDDLDLVLERAKAADVQYIVDIGYNRATIEQSEVISKRIPWIFSAFGFHPHDSKDIETADLEWLKEKLINPKCVAIGEIGLDYVKKHSPVNSQIKVLNNQLEIAKESKLPVIFHSRGAEDVVLKTALSRGIEKAVFHCYTGGEETAVKILESGYFISFAGFITYKKEPPEWIKRISLEQLLIETDSPYLAPVPYRGKRNEPSHVVHTCAKLAETLNLSAEELAEITLANAMTFFGIENNRNNL